MSADAYYSLPPKYVLPPPGTENINSKDPAAIPPCLGYSWPLTIKTVVPERQFLCPVPGAEAFPTAKAAYMVAMPDNRDVFRFVVPPGTFRVAHVTWELCPQPDGLRIHRVSTCVGEQCGSEEIRYKYRRNCDYTVLPPGVYEIEVVPVRVCVPTTAEGTTVNIGLYLEYVTRDFLLAATANK